MLSFDFLEKSLGEVFPPFLCMIVQRKIFLYYILLTGQILLSDCLYVLRYWVICLLQLIVSQVVTL